MAYRRQSLSCPLLAKITGKGASIAAEIQKRPHNHRSHANHSNDRIGCGLVRWGQGDLNPHNVAVCGF